MKNDGSKPDLPEAVRKSARDARLAEQLRANLKRRKAAARSNAARQQNGTEFSSAEPSDRPKKSDEGSAMCRGLRKFTLPLLLDDDFQA